MEQPQPKVSGTSLGKEVSDVEDVYCDQEEQVDGTFHSLPFAGSGPPVTIPISAGGRAQPWRFLDSTDGNIQTQVIEEPVGRGALLDLTLIKKGRLPEDVRVKGRLDCGDQEMVKLSILRGQRPRSQPWPLGAKTLVSSGIHLKESHGIEA